jgi:hypothetical protein
MTAANLPAEHEKVLLSKQRTAANPRNTFDSFILLPIPTNIERPAAEHFR